MHLLTYKVNPYILACKEENMMHPTPTEWLRTAVLMLVNRSKARLAAAGVNHDVFHNHHPQSGATIARYPLVLYQQLEDRLMITGINEGAEALKVLLSQYERPVEIDRNVLLGFVLKDERKFDVRLCDTPIHYSLTDWLPFNSDNYKHYQSLHRLSEKVGFLEHILHRHLTADFGHFFGLDLQQAEVALLGIDSFNCSSRHITVNGRKRDFQPFTIQFETNISLPDFICLGNGKVYGYGLLLRLN